MKNFFFSAPSASQNNRRASYTSIPSSSNHSTGTSSSHGESSEIGIFPYFTEGKAVILDVNRVTEALDAGVQTNLAWPGHLSMLRERTDVAAWDGWFPRAGMIADIIHEWKPGHKDKNRQSHLNKSIFLLRFDEYSVPILEDGINMIGEKRTSEQRTSFA